MKLSKPVAALLCVVMLLSLCFTATAETTVTSTVLSAYNLSLIKDSKVLIVRATSDSDYTLCDLDGNPLSDASYKSMRSASYGLIEVKSASDDINNIGVIDATGAVVVPTEYGDIKYLSDRWVLGAVLELANEENYDYKSYGSERQFYLITRYDVFYKGSKIGELGRTDVDYGYGYGAYMLIRNELGATTAYDSTFNKSPYEIRYTSEFEYDYSSKTVYHTGSGMAAFTEGCTLTAEDVASCYYELNNKLYDLQGNLIGEFSDYYYTYDPDNGYVYVQNNNKKYGITDLSGNIIVPVELDEKLYTSSGLFASGYQLVSRGGKLCYATPEEGIIFTSKISSSVSHRDVGVFTHVENDDGTRCVITPLGQLPESYKNVMSGSDSTSRIIAVQNNEDVCYVIGMAGEVVIPADTRADSLYDYAVSNDGTIVVVELGRNNQRLYDFAVYHVDYDASDLDTSALDDGSWVCECGSLNDRNFCPECGLPNPKNVK